MSASKIRVTSSCLNKYGTKKRNKNAARIRLKILKEDVEKQIKFDINKMKSTREKTTVCIDSRKEERDDKRKNLKKDIRIAKTKKGNEGGVGIDVMI